MKVKTFLYSRNFQVYLVPMVFMATLFGIARNWWIAIMSCLRMLAITKPLKIKVSYSLFYLFCFVFYLFLFLQSMELYKQLFVNKMWTKSWPFSCSCIIY